MIDIQFTNEIRGINFLPGCGGTINLVSLCGCSADAGCPAS